MTSNSSVPEDPKEGGELELLSQLFATHLLEVSLVAKGASPYYEEDMVKQVRRMNAVFRLSFRHPSKMQLTKAERELVVGLVQASIENMRRDFEAGAFPPSIFYSTLERFEEWKKRRRDNEEQ
ncbi:hypothetical protein AAVH_38139 [Aphelenchoides avenae]|nr:hypothetical protein AAVH_38139 [Aphelenchus avenae]